MCFDFIEESYESMFGNPLFERIQSYCETEKKVERDTQ